MLKKICLIGGLALLLVGCNTSNEVVEQPAQAKKETTQTANETTEIEVTEQDYIYMGEPAVVGGVSYYLTAIDVLDTVAGYTSESGVYVVLKIEVENNSNKAVELSNSMFTVIQNDAVYVHDPTTTAYHDKGFMFKKLNPNMSMAASIVYEMPKDVTDYPAVLQILPNQFKKDELNYILLAERP